MASNVETSWTHPSVVALGAGDPVAVIAERARELVLRAMDEGWTGPPYDPLRLAELLHVGVRPTEEVRDAQTVALSGGALRIDFNPTRPRARVRFSIAHELGHILFPDSAERVRKRASYHELTGDDWQLETLCNIAAAEIIMPVGSLPVAELETLSIEHLLDLRRRYDVSMEALLNRLVRVTRSSVAMFSASRHGQPEGRPSYRIEYTVGSPMWSAAHLRGHSLPPNSVVTQCTAIGMAAEAAEHWPTIPGAVGIRCVAVQPHPTSTFPRVVGLLMRDLQPAEESLLQEVPGNALQPRRAGRVVIAHIVNDRTGNWGGRGFAQALRGDYPQVQDDFKRWVATDKGNLSLGRVRFCDADSRITVASMVAQAGYGPSTKPRIRYAALEHCLDQVRMYAMDQRATVHMPRIGVGAGGGDWEVIRGIIDGSLCRIGVPVVVYHLPAPGDTERGTGLAASA